MRRPQHNPCVSTIRLEYAGLFMAREAGPQRPREAFSDAPEVPLHAACARTRAGENKT